MAVSSQRSSRQPLAVGNQQACITASESSLLTADSHSC